MKSPMRLLSATISLFVACLVAAGTTPPQKRGPSTPEERTKAVRLARGLENDPLGADAKESRRWLTLWLIEVPDISVKFCTELLGRLPDSKESYSPEISTQMMFSQAAFIIENPDKANDDFAIYSAGLESALKVYEGIRKKDPKAKWPYLDSLLEKRDKGELADYVRRTMNKCK